LQGEGNVGEARAAARRTRSPAGFQGRTVGRLVRRSIDFLPSLTYLRAERPEAEARRFHIMINNYNRTW
jgi:hypothetical protein